MKYCPICGTKLDDVIEFCPICGEDLRNNKSTIPEKEFVVIEQPESGEEDLERSENRESINRQENVQIEEQEQSEAKKERDKQPESKNETSNKGKKGILAVLAAILVIAVVFLFKQPEETSGPSGETQEPSEEVEEASGNKQESSSETAESSAESVELPEQREVDKEVMNKAYADVLNKHKAEILSYENKLKDLNKESGEINDAQIVLYDFNGDAVEELLFVADTDQGDEDRRTTLQDLYVFGFDGKKAVPVLQQEVADEEGGVSTYIVTGTEDYNLAVITISSDDTLAWKFGWNTRGFSTEYSLNIHQNSEGQYSLDENAAGTVDVDEQAAIEKTAEFFHECGKILLCNYMKGDLAYSEEEISTDRMMTYGKALAVLGVNLKPETEPDIPYYYDGHTYAFYNANELQLNSYAAVAEFCRRQNGHLAVINNPEENQYLFERVKENYVKTAFFGFSDENEEGEWLWAEGSSSYTNWTTEGDWDLPDNGSGWGGDEDYAEFNYERGKEDWVPCDGTWNDAPFRDNTDVFICEWDYEF